MLCDARSAGAWPTKETCNVEPSFRGRPYRPGSARLTVRTGPYIAGAGAAVVVAYERRSPFGVSDASRAVQSMILTAWADGVGSNWAGFGHLDGVREQVGLPDTYEVLCVVPFGYPKQAVKGRKNRKPLAEVASLGRYGTPYSPGSPGR